MGFSVTEPDEVCLRMFDYVRQKTAWELKNEDFPPQRPPQFISLADQKRNGANTLFAVHTALSSG